MRLARIAFQRMAMMRTEGMELHLFQEMLKGLPSDAKIVGFGEDISYGLCYVMVTSKQFKEVQEGYRPSDITAYFENVYSEDKGYEAVFKRLDMSEALEQASCCKTWDMKLYTGIMDSYKYCTKCGKKESK